MKNVSRFLGLLMPMLFFVGCAEAQSYFHYQPCHGQDTSQQYRTKTLNPVSIAISPGAKVAVAGHNYSGYGAKATVKVWSTLKRMMMGLKANDSIRVTQPGGLTYDNAGRLYVVQSERTDSNILIYDASLHLIRVISNSPGTPVSWFNPKGISLDSAQNIYVISGDSIGAGGVDIANTGKLVKISNPLTSPAKSTLLRNLNDPKAVVVKYQDLYITEYGNDELSRYNLYSMAKIDSAVVTKPMELYTTGCRLYCTEHDSNRVQIFDALHLRAGALIKTKTLDTNRGPFGIALNDDVDLLICDSNRVIYYSDSESVADTDIIHTYVAGGGGPSYSYSSYCLSNTFHTLHDSARSGVWHTNDSLVLAIQPDATYDSIVHYFGVVSGTYIITYTHGSYNDTFRVTTSTADIAPFVTVHDSARGGIWFTRDSAQLALVHTAFDSIIHVYSYRAGGGYIYYAHGSHIDTFVVSADTLISPTGIYTVGDVGNIYGSYRFCIGSIAELFDDTYGFDHYWSLTNPAIALIDEADGTVWPRLPGRDTVIYTATGRCNTVSEYFTITIDSDATAGEITGRQVACSGAAFFLYDSTSTIAGTWDNMTPAIATLGTAAGDSINITGLIAGDAIIKFHIDNTCADTLLFSVRVLEPPSAHGPAISGTTHMCPGATTNLRTSLTDTTIRGLWSSSSPSSVAITSSTDSTAVITGGWPGSAATIQFIATNQCGRDTSFLSAYVDSLPIVSVAGPMYFCTGTIATFSATPSGGTWSAVGRASAIISSSTSGTISTCNLIGLTGGMDIAAYSITTTCGTVSASQVFFVAPLPAAGIISGDSSLCLGATDTFFSTGYGLWSSTDTTVATIDSVFGIVHARGVGTVTIHLLDIEYCGTDTAFYSLTILPLPVAGPISGTSLICSGRSDTLLTPASGGIWVSADTATATISPVGVVRFVSAGIDTIKYIYSNSCGVDTATHVVTTVQSPTVRPIVGRSSVCIGDTIMLTDSTTGGSWHIPHSYATIASGIVTGVSAGSDSVYYSFTNACGTATAAHTVVVIAPVTPSDSITASTDSICSGDTVTFHVTSLNGGTTPMYQWQRSGTAFDTGATIHYVPVLGDVITCNMTSSATCPVPANVTSNSISMVVVPSVTPNVTIICTPGDSIAFIGQLVTFYATAIYGGTPTQYQWYSHGAPITGATNSMFSQMFYSNDTINCMITSSAPCATSPTAVSNNIVIYADYLGVQQVKAAGGNYVIFPNPTTGEFIIDSHTSSASQLSFEIRNVAGQVVDAGMLIPMQGKIHQTIVMGDKIPPGNYLFRIITPDGPVVLPVTKQ